MPVGFIEKNSYMHIKKRMQVYMHGSIQLYYVIEIK